MVDKAAEAADKARAADWAVGRARAVAEAVDRDRVADRARAAVCREAAAEWGVKAWVRADNAYVLIAERGSNMNGVFPVIPLNAPNAVSR